MRKSELWRDTGLRTDDGGQRTENRIQRTDDRLQGSTERDLLVDIKIKVR